MSVNETKQKEDGSHVATNGANAQIDSSSTPATTSPLQLRAAGSKRPSILITSPPLTTRHEPQSARFSHTGVQPHSVYTHAVLRKGETIGDGTTNITINLPNSVSETDLHQLPPHLNEPMSARAFPSSSSRLQANASIRSHLHSHAAHAHTAHREGMKSRAALDREALAKKEDAEAARLASMRDEENGIGGIGGHRREYNWRQLLEKPSEEREEDEVLYLMDWVSSLRIEFLLSLPREILMTLCRHFSLVQYPPDTYVFEQGDEGTHFYVILRGSVGVHVKDDEDEVEPFDRRRTKRSSIDNGSAGGGDDKPKQRKKYGSLIHSHLTITTTPSPSLDSPNHHSPHPPSTPSKSPQQPPKPGAPRAGFVEVMTMHTGDGFGEVALLNPNEKRSASIKTKEVCQFLIIDKKTYELALKDKASQERNRRENFVRNHIFFRRLVSEKQNSLITSLKEKIYPRHSVIIRQDEPIVKEGENTSQIYFVASGTVMIKMKIRPQEAAIDALARQNQQIAKQLDQTPYAAASIAATSAAMKDHMKTTLMMPSIQPPPLVIRGGHHGNTTTSNSTNANNNDGLNVNEEESVPTTVVRRSVGAASKSDVTATTPFSSTTHGYGSNGGSNLDSFSQLIELGRIGSGSFFAEEGIVIDNHLDHRTYSAVADERVVCYALDRIAFHKSIKGNILAMLQEMARNKKELREKRIEAILKNYIQAQTIGLSFTNNPTHPSQQRHGRFGGNGTGSIITPSTAVSSLSIFHLPTRSKPVNLRHFGVVRLAGQVPRVLHEDEADATRENAWNANEVFDDDEDDDDGVYHASNGSPSNRRPRTPIHHRRRSSINALPWEDFSTMATEPPTRPGTSSASSSNATTAQQQRRQSRRRTGPSLLESAQARSIAPAKAIAAAVAKRERSRSRSQSRAASRANSRPGSPDQERSQSRSSSRGRSENGTDGPTSNSGVPISSAHPHSHLTQNPPPMVPSSTVYALLGKKSSATPLAILTQQSIPFSALSALSPQPLPLQAIMPAMLQEELEKKLLEEAVTVVVDKPELSPPRTPTLQVQISESKPSSKPTTPSSSAARLEIMTEPRPSSSSASTPRATESIREGNEAGGDAAATNPTASVMLISRPGSKAPSNASSRAVSRNKTPDRSKPATPAPIEGSEVAIDSVLNDTNLLPPGPSDGENVAAADSDEATSLPPGLTPAEKLDQIRNELRAREAWKTSPRRFSVLSRVMGIGTGHGNLRVKDNETGTILSDTTQAAKKIEERIDSSKQAEMKRLHIMASLQRSEPSSAREPNSARSMANEPTSARGGVMFMDGISEGTKSSNLLQVNYSKSMKELSATHEEEKQQPSVSKVQSMDQASTSSSQVSLGSSASKGLLLRAHASSHKSADPILSSASFTSRSGGPFLFGSSGTLTTASSSLSPFVLAANTPPPPTEYVIQETPEESEAHKQQKLTEGVIRKHRFIPKEDLPVDEFAPQPSSTVIVPSLALRQASLDPMAAANFSNGLASAAPFPSITSQQQQQPSSMFKLQTGSQTARSSLGRQPSSSLGGGNAADSHNHYLHVGKAPAGSMTARTVRPYHSISRAGQISLSLTKLNLSEAKAAVAQNRFITDGNGCFVYEHTTSGSSAPASSGATTAPSVPSGPSLLSSDTVSAIERYLHTQLLLDQEATFALPTPNGVLKRGKKTAQQLNQGTCAQINIRKLEELATRTQRRLNSSSIGDAMPHPPNNHSSNAANTTNRRHSAFSVAALLNMDLSSTTPLPPAPAPTVAVPMLHQWKHQLDERF